MKGRMRHLTIAMLATATTIGTANANPRMGGGVYVPQVNVPRGGVPMNHGSPAGIDAARSAVDAARAGTGAAVFGPTVGGIDNAPRYGNTAPGPLTTSINTSLVPGSDITEYNRPEPWKSPAQRAVEYLIGKGGDKVVDKVLENTSPGAVPVNNSVQHGSAVGDSSVRGGSGDRHGSLVNTVDVVVGH